MKKKSQPDIFQMCEVQHGVVHCAMLSDIPHPIKILGPTPHCEKWIRQQIPFFIMYSYFFNIKILLHISMVRGGEDLCDSDI